MATCCDDNYDRTTPKAPLLIEVFNKESIPYKNYYLFNNKDIYRKPVTNAESLRIQVETSYWNANSTSFTQFFAALNTTTPTHLIDITKEIQKKHKKIHANLHQLIRELGSQIQEIEKHEQERRAIEETITDPKNPNFTKEVEVLKLEMVDIEEPNVFSTKCETCNKICHYPCYINEGNFIRKTPWWCSAMAFYPWYNPFNVRCTQCEGRCSWRNHTQIRQKEIEKIYRQTDTDETLKETYLREQEGAINLLNKKCESEMVSAYHEILRHYKMIQQDIDYINENSISTVSSTMKDFADDLIEAEKENKGDGYKMRIQFLKKVVEIKDQDSASQHDQQAISFIQNIRNRHPQNH